MPHALNVQFIRYLCVGVFNTALGYGTFALFTAVFTKSLPSYGYMLAAALSGFISVSVAFLAHKRFVFRTKGNYLRESILFYSVYGSSTLLGLLLLPLIVYALRRIAGLDSTAPYVAGALLICFNTTYNFIGNKRITFKPRAAEKA